MIRIRINGIVQGVGFRPFVYNLAHKLEIKGYVLNSNEGVEIAAEGNEENLKGFISKLQEDTPPAALIDRFEVHSFPDNGFTAFEIRRSLNEEGKTFISPDLAVCPDCIREMNDPDDKRYEYPFINCTNCGPRYSIIENTPYDRPATSMADFELCDFCRSEYEDPADRRFHAQPVACPLCGPELSFLDGSLKKIEGNPIDNSLKMLLAGKIVGIKGIGGFHIACDATNEESVAELRKRKKRPAKPFAIMTTPENVRKIVDCSDNLFQLLLSPSAPVVLLPKLNNIPIARSVAPLNPNIGLFLPYAPHHYQIFKTKSELFLVMTSGNISDEPLATDEKELLMLQDKDANNRGGICDFYLTHNRRILNRNDDSVILPASGSNIMIRRSRGYVPSPLSLPEKVVPTLGTGSELKLVFALADKDLLYLSPYIGNNNSKATEDFYLETLRKYKKWFRIEPELVACDLHPDYLTTHFADSLDLPLVRIQHHHAHIAAVMAENMLDEEVIGISYDGTGLGEDGAVWGGEIFTANYSGYTRRYHLSYMPLAGGDAAIRYPVRIAYAYLLQTGADTTFLTAIPETEKRIIRKQLLSNWNLIPTSSMGRLFDSVAAMLGLFPEISFEAQSAMALEFLCEREDPTLHEPYSYQIDNSEIDIIPLLKGVLTDLTRGMSNKTIALRFHKTVIAFTLEAVKCVAAKTGLNKVILSGGVMQNVILLDGLRSELERNNFTVFFSSKLPSNDGAISAGQVMIANRIIDKVK
jgi:hydrogenase maturation protein HypF